MTKDKNKIGKRYCGLLQSVIAAKAKRSTMIFEFAGGPCNINGVIRAMGHSIIMKKKKQQSL